jgi:uncharacterized protein (DUF1810 family)
MRDLERFVSAQGNGIYSRAIAELRAGQKRTHWMWFIFPQIAGLGKSEAARFYAIENIAQARAFLAHPILGPRVAECTDAMLAWARRRTALAVLGPIDSRKFASSMTLFEAASAIQGPFTSALDAFFDGVRDRETLERV